MWGHLGGGNCYIQEHPYKAMGGVLDSFCSSHKTAIANVTHSQVMTLRRHILEAERGVRLSWTRLLRPTFLAGGSANVLVRWYHYEVIRSCVHRAYLLVFRENGMPSS